MDDVYSVRLVVQQKPDAGYLAKWVEEDGQESEPFELILPLGKEAAAELRWYLEDYYDFVGAGTRVRAAQVEKDLDSWGRALFEACFGTVAGTHVLRNLQGAIADGRRAMLTIGTSFAAVLAQPWEMMRDRGGPLVFQGLILRRQLTGARQADTLKLELPLRILMVVSRPVDTGFIDPRNSFGPMLDALEKLPSGAVEIDLCQPPTLAQLEKKITSARQGGQPFHVLHFDGHGDYLPQTGVGVLCFENEDHRSHHVRGKLLGDLLVREKVPLVLLEACRTADLSAVAFDSVAPALLDSRVGSVVAFSHSVHIEAARLLVASFYAGLVNGSSVGEALADARRMLRAQPRRFLHLGPDAASVDIQDWFIPQLYQVGADPALLAKKSKPGKKVTPPPPPEERMFGFPPKPIYRFHGRARDLLELERAFERHRAILLTGGGGMGKTALAREAAFWWLRTGRFERAVFVSFERPATVERVVQELGRAVEGTDFASRQGEEQHKAALELFRARRVLLVWDNFESTLPQFQQGEAGGPVAYAEEERSRLRQFYQELTDRKGEGRLLVTCRPAEATLPGIKERSLAGLHRPDSLHLVHAIADLKDIGLERKGYEREEIEKLLDLLGDHPLSLSLVVPHLKSLRPAEIRSDFGSLLNHFKDESADVERNRSLLASLAFSTSRLSEAAREVLPYLAWFQGGAFESNVLLFTQLSPDAWSAIRSELEATALLLVEAFNRFNVPFLRFHPTLSYATRRQEVAEVEAAEQRFVAVYLGVRQEVDAALKGNAAAAGMALMEREEANFRSALEIAFRRGERQLGWQLAHTLGVYLPMAARLFERDTLVDWVRGHMSEGSPLDGATCAAIRQQAFSLVGRGRAEEAIALMQQLIGRLAGEGLADGEDPAFELGTSVGGLGQIFTEALRPDLALAPSLESIRILEMLPHRAAQANLSAALGDLANAYRALGRPREALAAAERALAIDRESGQERSVAAGLGQIGEILAAQQRWTEAEARYDEALDLARRIGDLELQGILLQHQGGLNFERGHPARAADFYEQAILLFQEAGNSGGEMRTCDSLASAEQRRGRLDSAEAWYRHAHELATELNNQWQLGAIAQNVGILYQTRSEEATDAKSRASWLRRAVGSIEESLKIWLERNDEIHAASSYLQLGVLYRQLEDYTSSEINTLRALRIYESLDHPNVFRNYEELAELAIVRGEAAAAAEWAAKRDAKLAELKQLRGGGGEAGQLARLAEPLLALARAVYAARASRAELEPQAAEAVATLRGMPPPLAELGEILRAVAPGEPMPALPPGLPAEVVEIFEELAQALAELPE